MPFCGYCREIIPALMMRQSSRLEAEAQFGGVSMAPAEVILEVSPEPNGEADTVGLLGEDAGAGVGGGARRRTDPPPGGRGGSEPPSLGENERRTRRGKGEEEEEDIIVVENVHKTYLLGIEGVAALR